MALNALFSLTCPSCGAQVPIFSATSALAVCEYCHSMLVREGDGLADTGKKSALFEDFSPLQLYTSGTYQGDPFTVIGVLQLQYDRGSWSEWYILFADGTNGWLADFSGQYVITREAKPIEKPLPFDKLVAGVTQVIYSNVRFLASDVRKATSVKANARGELPFTLNKDEVVLGADFRYRNLFLTLDYSQNAQAPKVYQGKAVELENLHCQNLRTDDQIKSSAGRLKGQRASLNCPNCGAPLSWYPGIAQNIICQSCHSDIALTDGNAQILGKHKMRQAQIDRATLKLGETAHINGSRWALIGMMRVQETPPEPALEYINKQCTKVPFESDFWFEYLLYSPSKGFIWLVESDGKWDISHSAKTWPAVALMSAQPIPLDPKSNKPLPQLYAYGGQVQYAAGAFYWRVEPQDVTYYQDYAFDQGKLCAERTHEELNWSISKPVTGEELAKWFKRPELLKAVGTSPSGGSAHPLSTMFMIIYFVLNLPAAFAALASGEDFPFIGLFITSWAVLWVIYRGSMPFQVNDDDD